VPNQWPDWIPDFRQDVLAYYEAVQGVGASLFKAFAVGLGLPDDFFVQLTRKTPSQLRLLHYPPRAPDAPDDAYGSAPHTDYGFTDHPAVARDMQRRYIDLVIEAARASARFPEGSRFKWTTETTVAVNDRRKRAMGRKVIQAMGGDARGKTVAYQSFENATRMTPR